jgi:hypothetical protein
MRSAFFLFQFSPPCIETINHLPGFLELGANVPKIEAIAHVGRIFQGGTFGEQFLLGIGDTFFDGCKLAGLNI